MTETIKLFAHHALERIPNILIGAVIFSAFVYGGRFLAKFVQSVLWRHRRAKYHAASMLISRMVRIGIAIFGTLVALSIIVPTFRASDLINFLGVSGVAVGFAFRDILQNFFAGIIIICSRVFDEGDHVKTGEISGTVEEIQLRSTLLRTHDGERIVVPNALLLNREVRLGGAYDAHQSEFEMPVSVDLDIREAQKLAMDVLRAHKLIQKQPPPTVTVERFVDKQVFIKLTWWVAVRDTDASLVRNEVVSEIHTRLRTLRPVAAPAAAGGKIADNQAIHTPNDLANRRRGIASVHTDYTV